MTAPPALTLIVPAYNEASRLVAGLARLAQAAADGALDLDSTEVLFVDDGSTDETSRTAQQLAASVPVARVLAQPRNLGKGAAVRRGMLAAHGAHVVFADADMAIDPHHLPALVDALARAPIAVGTRAVGGHVDYGSVLRTRAGRLFNRAVRTIGGVHLADTQCGFKGFRRGEGQLLAQLQTISGYAFDVELLWLASRLGFAVEAVPVTWLDVKGSSVRVVRDSLPMLADLAAARRRHRFVAIADTDVLDAAPAGTVLLRGSTRTALCGGVESMGAMRRALGSATHVELCNLDELCALAPFEVVPAP